MRNKFIRIQVASNVAVIWLNRPAALNAVDDAMVRELDAALVLIETDSSVRAVVLAGEGRAFCAGTDLSTMERLGNAGLTKTSQVAQRFAGLLYRLYRLKKPTIARVHGASDGAGIGLIAACDIAVASLEATFCMSETRLGLAAASVAPYLLQAIGARQASRYMLSAETFTAAEAYRIGLIQELAPFEELDSTVNGLLGNLLLGGPKAQVASKEIIGQVSRCPITPDLVANLSLRTAELQISSEGREGSAAFLGKRQPAWAARKKKTGRTRK